MEPYLTKTYSVLIENESSYGRAREFFLRNDETKNSPRILVWP